MKYYEILCDHPFDKGQLIYEKCYSKAVYYMKMRYLTRQGRKVYRVQIKELATA